MCGAVEEAETENFFLECENVEREREGTLDFLFKKKFMFFHGSLPLVIYAFLPQKGL